MFLTTLAIEAKDSKTVELWLEQNPDLPLTSCAIYPQMTKAKALVYAKKYNAAIPLLKRLRILCKKYNRTINLIEVDILTSICMISVDEYLCIRAMYDAVALAQKHILVRVFLDVSQSLDALELLNRKAKYYQLIHVRTALVQKVILLMKNEIASGNMNRDSNAVTLSKRQKAVLVHLDEGLTYQQICDKSGLKITTIRTHIMKLYEKLGVTNKEAAVAKAKEIGLLDWEW